MRRNLLPRLVGTVCAALSLGASVSACSSLDPFSVLPAFADEMAPARSVDGVKLRVAPIDLTDPNTVLDVGLAPGQEHQTPGAHPPAVDEEFETMVAKARPAIAVNGTFFSEDHTRRLMGDVVRDGQLIKYTPWEDRGTTFILHAGNRPEMVTERAQGSPDRSSHWLSLTAGPRLLRDGKVYLHPHEEGFKDPDVFGTATRTALGFTREGHTLMLVSFVTPVSLKKEALVMKKLGTFQAMNLDGGTSQALAAGGRTLIAPGRRLTNILAVYDHRYPAPATVASTWASFGERHPDPVFLADPGARPGDRWLGKLQPGKVLSYAGMHFKTRQGDPVVGVLNGMLAFSEGNFGQIYADWTKPRQRFALDFEAKLLDEHLAVSLSPNLTVEVRRAAPAGIFVRKGGVAIARDYDYVPDLRWHRYHVVDDAGHLRVQVDGRSTPAVVCAAAGPACGLGLSGRGDYRQIKVASSGR